SACGLLRMDALCLLLAQAEVRELAQTHLSGAAPCPTEERGRCGRMRLLQKDRSIARDEIALESDNDRGELESYESHPAASMQGYQAQGETHAGCSLALPQNAVRKKSK